jgi:macrodomain Ter protein organizer (MatP/YcbG family)|tara:strand:+ start:335 stop:493 length:159 start_codon:yes stop_codon:yes gene_type:complete
MDKTKYKSVALSIDTYSWLKERAEKEDRTITGTVRNLIKKAMEKEKPSEGMR